MTTPLRAQLADLANQFAASVLAAIRGASLDEILAHSQGAKVEASRPNPGRPSSSSKKPVARPAAPAPQATPKVAAKSAAKIAPPARAPKAKKTKGGRLARRSADDIANALELVVALLRSTKGGLRSEQVRAHLGMNKEELPRVLKEGLTTRQLKSKGQKRSTVYTAA
jgi:hypothetical protein